MRGEWEWHTNHMGKEKASKIVKKTLRGSIHTCI